MTANLNSFQGIKVNKFMTRKKKRTWKVKWKLDELLFGYKPESSHL